MKEDTPQSRTASEELPKVAAAASWIRAQKKGTRISILTHNDPDVDAMSSAMAFSEIVAAMGHEARIYHYGQVAHPQNRVFTNQFDWTGQAIRLKEADNEESIAPIRKAIEDTALVILDTSCPIGTGNLSNVEEFFPGKRDYKPALVIDHHERIDQPVGVVYQRCQVGACATIIWEIARELKCELSREASTALLLGIELDTSGLREDVVTDRDSTAYEALRQVYDGRRYLDVINYPKSAVFLGMKKRAYCTLIERDSVLVGGVGIIDREQKSLMASIADELMNYDCAQHALVVGLITDGKDDWYLAISYRTSSGVVNADELVKCVFGPTFGAKKGAGAGEGKVNDPYLAILQHGNLESREEAFDLMFHAYAERFVAMRRKLS
jgi:nanoRNase/pAp phosphatase (c-di-AMP/oligoRNAs hydrolase)